MQTLANGGGEPPAAAPYARLSTDYLNRHGEALMLLEMALTDPAIVADLRLWQAVDYRTHFETSRLRCTASALDAYDRLTCDQRMAFDTLCQSMNRLIVTATAVLSEPDRASCPVEAATIVEVASEALRNLISRATHFINANGLVDVSTLKNTSLQDEIDALFAN